MFFLCPIDKTASFVITPAHDMEFWVLKMLILLKFHFFISSLLDFLFCVLLSSHSNSENHSCNFLKFCESATNIMRLCLQWASANRILLRKLVIQVKLWRFRYAIAYRQIGVNTRNWAQQFSFKDGDVNVQWKQPFLSASSSLLPKCLQSSLYVVILVWALVWLNSNCCSKFFENGFVVTI